MKVWLQALRLRWREPFQKPSDDQRMCPSDRHLLISVLWSQGLHPEAVPLSFRLSVHNPVAVAEQAPEEPVYQPAESRAQILELMTQDTDSVMETLSQAGMEATSTGQIENGPVAGIMSGLAEDMKTNPEGASDAILAFNTNGMGHIAKYEIPEDATPEEAELMSAHKDNATFGVQYVNQSNVEAFYYQMMLDERAGKTLSDKTLENMAKFTEMEGISVDYQHWCPGMALDQPLLNQ